MSTLLAWVLAATSTLAPNQDHERLAEAIAARVESEEPLFKNDVDRKKTAALLVAVAFRESSLKRDAVGDHFKGKPTSFCAYQIHLPGNRKTPEGWTGQDLLDDADKCVAAALRMLRESVKSCPSHPLATYAEGPPGCASVRAQRISRDRLALAQRLVKKVTVSDSRAAEAEVRERPRPLAYCRSQRRASVQTPTSEPALRPS